MDALPLPFFPSSATWTRDIIAARARGETQQRILRDPLLAQGLEAVRVDDAAAIDRSRLVCILATRRNQ